MRLASATISSERLFSKLEGLSAIARVEPGAKIAALQPFRLDLPLCDVPYIRSRSLRTVAQCICARHLVWSMASENLESLPLPRLALGLPPRRQNAWPNAPRRANCQGCRRGVLSAKRKLQWRQRSLSTRRTPFASRTNWSPFPPIRNGSRSPCNANSRRLSEVKCQKSFSLDGAGGATSGSSA